MVKEYERIWKNVKDLIFWTQIPQPDDAFGHSARRAFSMTTKVARAWAWLTHEARASCYRKQVKTTQHNATRVSYAEKKLTSWDGRTILHDSTRSNFGHHVACIRWESASSLTLNCMKLLRSWSNSCSLALYIECANENPRPQLPNKPVRESKWEQTRKSLIGWDSIMFNPELGLYRPQPGRTRSWLGPQRVILLLETPKSASRNNWPV